MLEGSVDLEDQGQQNRIGPDLFSFYKCEIVDLLNQDENFLPLSSRIKEKVQVSSDVSEDGKGKHNLSQISSLFIDSIESGIPHLKRELLQSLLQQSVRALAQEVDEMFDPIIRIRHVISCLNSKRRENSVGKAPTVGDSTTLHRKRRKKSSTNVKGELLDDKSGDGEKETDVREMIKVSEDLKLLLESEPFLVEETMNKQSNELLLMLNHMEKQVEDLLYAVVSKCRPMTRQEKKHLQKLIANLPARNLGRIVEIIHYGKSSDTISLDEIFVDLEDQKNATLWRLYFYVRAAENAEK